MQVNDIRDNIFGELYKIMKKDAHVILLTCDTGAFLFKELKENLPKQFFNVGISEQNAISVASGLALSGNIVYVFGISNFVSLRCYEQIKLDVCSMNLPVNIIGMGTGYMYASDGCTHHMIEDLSIIKTLPNMTLWNISCPHLASFAIRESYESKQPNFIRFDRHALMDFYSNNTFYPYKKDNGYCLLRDGKDALIISTGIMTNQAIKVSDSLTKEKIKVGVLDVYKFPIKNELSLSAYISRAKNIITLEENCMNGGLSDTIAKVIVKNKIKSNIRFIGIDNICRQNIGDREYMRSLNGLDEISIQNTIREIISC